MPGRSMFVLPVAAVLAFGAVTGCSNNGPDQPDGLSLSRIRAQPCTLVSEAAVSAALRHEVTASSKGGVPCTYTPTTAGASAAVVELRTRAGADDPSRLLPNGRPLDGVGTVARFDPQGGPLGARLVARKAGSLVIVDLGPAPDAKARSQAATIARTALRRAPASRVTTTAAAASDGPCEQLGDGKALAKALDAPVSVTPAYPAGCSIIVTGRGNAMVQAEVLGAKAAKVIDSLARGTDGKAWTKEPVEDLGDAAAWLADPTTPGAGQLAVAVADDKQLLIVTTDASAGNAEAGKELAIATARSASG